MLIIQQNQINQLVTTLNEKKQFDINIYFLEFVNNSSKEAFYCYAEDKSTTTRYNLFCITEVSGSTVDYSYNKIYLPLKGQYTYTVFEFPDVSLPLDATHLVEIGRCLVIGGEECIPTYSNNSPVNGKILTFYQKNPNS